LLDVTRQQCSWKSLGRSTCAFCCSVGKRGDLHARIRTDRIEPLAADPAEADKSKARHAATRDHAFMKPSGRLCASSKPLSSVASVT